MRVRGSHRGVTIVEIILTIVILTLVSGVTVFLLGEALQAHFVFLDTKNLHDEFRAGFDRLVMDLNRLRSPGEITIFTADEIRFTDTNNTDVHVTVFGNQILRNGVPLVSHLEAPGGLTIRYWDLAGGEVVPGGGDPSTIHMLTISVKAKREEQTQSYTTDIFPSNFRNDLSQWNIK